MALIKMKVEDSKINDIGDAIREKTGSSQLYTIDDMPAAIRAIPSSDEGLKHIINLCLQVDKINIAESKQIKVIQIID